MTIMVNKEIDEKLLSIAKKHFFVETLEPRNRDSLDFHSVSVWGIQNALREAYELGLVENKKK